MEQIISNYGAFILFLVIVFIVWLFSKYLPVMKVRLSEMEVNDWIKRLESDMKHCPTLESLDRLEKKGDLVIEKAKSMVADTKPYEDRLMRAYNNRHWYLINEYTRPGISQSLIPFLTIR